MRFISTIDICSDLAYLLRTAGYAFSIGRVQSKSHCLPRVTIFYFKAPSRTLPLVFKDCFLLKELNKKLCTFQV